MKDVTILTNNGINVKKSLELFGTMEKYDNALATFLNSIEDNIAKLKSYKEISEMFRYSRISHSIKSLAQYFGFEKLAELALKHELESKQNNIYAVCETFDEFVAEINRVVDVSRQYFGDKT